MRGATDRGRDTDSHRELTSPNATRNQTEQNDETTSEAIAKHLESNCGDIGLVTVGDLHLRIRETKNNTPLRSFLAGGFYSLTTHFYWWGTRI